MAVDPASGAVPEAAATRPPLRALMDDSLLDELLARSRDACEMERSFRSAEVHHGELE